MFLLLLLGGIIRGIGYVVSKYISLGKGSSHAMALGNAMVDTLVSLPILVYFLLQPGGMQLDPGLMLLAFISAGAYGFCVVMQYAALKRIDMSVMGIVLRLGILFSSLFGVLFLGEQLNGWNWLGLAAILLGNFIVLSNNGRITLSLGVIFTLIAGIFSAIASNMDKFILTRINSVLYVFVNSFLIALALFLMKPKVIKESFKMIRARFPVFLFMSILTILAWLIGSYVLQNMDVSKFIPVQKTITLIIPVLFGILIFHERKYLGRKVLGLILAALGIALMYL